MGAINVDQDRKAGRGDSEIGEGQQASPRKCLLKDGVEATRRSVTKRTVV